LFLARGREPARTAAFPDFRGFFISL